MVALVVVKLEEEALGAAVTEAAERVAAVTAEGVVALVAAVHRALSHLQTVSCALCKCQLHCSPRQRLPQCSPSLDDRRTAHPYLPDHRSEGLGPSGHPGDRPAATQLFP